MRLHYRTPVCGEQGTESSPLSGRKRQDEEDFGIDPSRGNGVLETPVQDSNRILCDHVRDPSCYGGHRFPDTVRSVCVCYRRIFLRTFRFRRNADRDTCKCQNCCCLPEESEQRTERGIFSRLGHGLYCCRTGTSGYLDLVSAAPSCLQAPA